MGDFHQLSYLIPPRIGGLGGQNISIKKLFRYPLKEVLLGLKLAEYDTNSIKGNQINHQIQFDRLQEEYEYMKDTAKAYDELMRYHHQ